jgi:hypothetical protein
MQFGLLITDHGKHSDEKFAIATASELIQIAATAEGKQAIDARRLENDIIDVLTGHFAKVSKDEVSGLDSNAAEHMVSRLDPLPHMEGILDKVLTVCKASAFKEWFERGDVKQLMFDKIASWTATAIHMHRDWFSQGYTGHGTDLKQVPEHRVDADYIKTWRYRCDVGGHGAGLPPALVQQYKDGVIGKEQRS